MDPALWELVNGSGDDEVEAIICLSSSEESVPDSVRAITRFGNIVTCRLRRDVILATHRHESVLSLKAPRLLTPDVILEPAVTEAPEEVRLSNDFRRPEGIEQTGRNVVVGVIDWGCDFTHPNFRHADGSTRLLAIWDQRGAGSVKPYGYGTVHTAEEIDRALCSADPFRALEYQPALSDVSGAGAHGTHVMDIAAGNGLAGGPIGMAPEADLVFVQLASHGTGGLADLGDSVTVLEAVDFIAKVAGDKPWVINLSMGRTGGDHTGTSLVEQGLDAAVTQGPARAICQSTGNYYHQRMHASALLRPGESRTFVWETDAADVTPNELECWYSGRDSLIVELKSPTGDIWEKVGLGGRIPIQLDGERIGNIYHRVHDPNSGDNHINIFLYPNAPAGEWEVRLIGEDVVDGRINLWVERDAARPRLQSRFHPDDADPLLTTGTICNGFRTIAVGAYDPHSSNRALSAFSSSGPTRDGRVKPDLVAPGVRILAARSASLEGERVHPTTRKSGTSMAAPHVTGTVALMFEAASHPLSIIETRRLLLNNTQSVITDLRDETRIGSGYLDVEAAVNAVRRLLPEASEEIVYEPSDVYDDITTLENGAVRDIKDSVATSSSEGRGDRDMNNMTINTLVETQHQEQDNQTSDTNEDKHQHHVVHSNVASSAEAITSIHGRGLLNVRSNGHFELIETNIVDVAEHIITADEADLTSAQLLNRLMGGVSVEPTSESTSQLPAFISPAVLFDSLAYRKRPSLSQRFANIFEIVGAPGLRLTRPVEPGDLLLRRALGEGQLAHLSILVSGELNGTPALSKAELITEDQRPGMYVHVIEAGPFPHSVEHKFARRLTSRTGWVDHDQMIVRIRPRIAPKSEQDNIHSYPEGMLIDEELGFNSSESNLLEVPTPPANLQFITHAGPYRLAYDRLTGLGNIDPTSSRYIRRFRGTAALQSALDRWASYIQQIMTPPRYILTAGLYVNKSGEHGRGSAVDIDGFWWSNSERFRAIDAPSDWYRYITIEATLRQVFGTVLNYDYNAAHRDHWHCDLGRPTRWRAVRSQAKFAQRALNEIWGERLVVDGRWGSRSAAAAQRSGYDFRLVGGWDRFLNDIINRQSSL